MCRLEKSNSCTFVENASELPRILGFFLSLITVMSRAIVFLHNLHTNTLHVISGRHINPLILPSSCLCHGLSCKRGGLRRASTSERDPDEFGGYSSVA